MHRGTVLQRALVVSNGLAGAERGDVDDASPTPGIYDPGNGLGAHGVRDSIADERVSARAVGADVFWKAVRMKAYNYAVR